MIIVMHPYRKIKNINYRQRVNAAAARADERIK